MPTGVYPRSEEHCLKLSEGRKGKSHSKEARHKMSEANKGKTHSEETRLKISEALKGRNRSEEHCLKLSKAQKGKSHSKETRLKISLAHQGKLRPELKGKPLSKETRHKMSEAHKGAKNHLWRGGITSIHQGIRGSLEYKFWREAVFARDNYTCVFCGDNRRGNLQADHIKPFSLFSELRFDIDNGRILCIPCHKTTSTFGRRTKPF